MMNAQAKLKLITCFALSVAASGLRAQVLEIGGGSSTLYEAQGASLTFHDASNESGLSGGISGGHVQVGFYARHFTPIATYTLGLQTIRLGLPTDVFSGQHQITGLGVGVITHSSGAKLEAFAGASSTQLDSPYVQGSSNLKPSASFVLTRPLTGELTLSAQLLAASSSTLLTSLQWKPKRSVEVAATGGFGGFNHYAAASINLNQPRHTVQAEYISAGNNFHRSGSQPDLSPEFIHENISYVFRSSPLPRFTLSAARQNFLTPSTDASTGSPPISTVNQLNAFQQVKALRVNAALFSSAYQGRSNLAYTISASYPLPHHIEVQNSFFDSVVLNESNPHSRSLVVSFREQLSSHLSVSENINQSGGQTSVGFGGSFQSGFGSVSVDSQTVYLATRLDKPFQQTLMVDVQLTLLGRVLVHAGSFVSPTGRLLYTADAHSVQTLAHGVMSPTKQASLGNALLHGRVVDQSGAPIVGAAIEIDGALNFTDSEGDFYLRERKPALHHFHIALDDFLDGLHYRVTSQPMELSSSRIVHAPVIIVVERAN